MDPRRRLLVGAALRAQLGWAANATVVARTDADRGVLELMAASLVEPQLGGMFDAHRRDPRSPAAEHGASRPHLTALPGGRLPEATTPAPCAAADQAAARRLHRNEDA